MQKEETTETTQRFRNQVRAVNLLTRKIDPKVGEHGKTK